VSEFPQHTPNLLQYVNALEQALEAKSWYRYKATFSKFIETELVLKSKLTEFDGRVPEVIQWGNVIEALLKQLNNNHGALTIAKKRAALDHVLTNFSQDLEQLYIKLEALIDSWTKPLVRESIDNLKEISLSVQHNNPFFRARFSDNVDSEQQPGITRLIDQLLELQAQMLESIADIQVSDVGLMEEARILAQQLRKIQDEQEVEQCISSLEQFCCKFEPLGKNDIHLQQGLLKLLNLLIGSTSYLLSDDQWVRNKISMLQEAISKPLDARNIAQAEHFTWKKLFRDRKQ
jgi:diguanylate cyclase